MSRTNLSFVRHELRTPINHIIGYSEMLQEEAEDQGYECFIPEFQKIREMGQQLLALVNEGLDSSAADTSQSGLLYLHEHFRKPVNQIIRCTDDLRRSAKGPAHSIIVNDLKKIRAAAAKLMDLTNDEAAITRWEPDALSASSPGYYSQLTFPQIPDVTASDEDLDDHGSENAGGYLLVVEDNETTRDMLCRRLERQGHRVAAAENGRLAMEMLQTNSFDLILLDIVMPSFDGFQVLEQLKSDDSLRHIPVIMLSALEEVDSAVRCIEMGAEDYLTKPFNSVLLKARIDACLEKKRLRDQEVLHLQEIETINAELEKRVEERVKELKKSNQQLAIEVAERKRLDEQLQSKIGEMAVVDEIARIITSTLNLDQAYEKFALEMPKLLDFDRLSVNIIHHDSYSYELKYLFGQDMPDRQMGDITHLHGSQTEYVMQTRKSIIRADVSERPTFNIDQVLLDVGLHSAIMSPLISKDRVIGVIGLRSRNIGAYGEREQVILERLAKQIAPALENARLYEETKKEKERATATLAQLRALLDGVDAGIMLLGHDDQTVLWANHRFAEFFGLDDSQLLVDDKGVCQRLREASRDRLANADEVFEETTRIIADRHYSGTEGLEFIQPERRTIRRFTTPIYQEHGEYLGRLWVYYDVTEQRKLQEQLLQSQKMESIGRLAGGIAHDFNNLLTPIMGYATLGSMYLTPEHPSQGHLDEVKKAAERASSLTHQLLAFSKGQVIEPKVIDLNALVLNMNELLRRIIGEDIELVTLPASNLDLVKADPGQIEQVLLNLVINARDAMLQGGKLTIETANVHLGAEEALQHPASSSGKHVMISVTDCGIGMTEEVKAHLFEPFFTTKEKGKGTGLGLATCYGIIEQSGGRIEVDSAVGKGTTFRIYLPVTIEVCELLPAVLEEKRLPYGTETVLLAEDEPAVRSMMATVLEQQGYTVLQAANGGEALKVAEGHHKSGIDLLLTDVVMPQMGGVELAGRFCTEYPKTKVIFTSGYSDQPIMTLNNSDARVDFIQKPFMPAVLANKVREVLDKA
jgi:two-component system cell cycle sensor histidine kinase/response regulator CckA